MRKRYGSYEWLLSPINRMSGSSEKIMVRAPNWIGDAVLCLPAIDALKAHLADASITVLAKPRVVPLFLNNPNIKEIIEYDAGGTHKGVQGMWRLAVQLKRHGFDIAVLFQNAFEAALIAFMAAIPERVGYATDGRSPLLTMAIRKKDIRGNLHQVDYYLGIIRALDTKTDLPAMPALYLSASETGWAKMYLSESGVREGMPIAGLAPGAAYGPAKRWRHEGFADVAKRLRDDYGIYPLILGDKNDMEICSVVESGIGKGCLNLSGRTSLREAMAIISICNLFVSNDSGLMHISAALGIPTIALFGSTNPAVTGPLGRRSKVVYKSQGCSPCFKRVCPTDFRCMNEITADDVMAAIAQLMVNRA